MGKKRTRSSQSPPATTGTSSRSTPKDKKKRIRTKTSRGAVIESIGRAYGKLERVRAVREAKAELDHWSEADHDAEVADGAPEALTRLLLRALHVRPKVRDSDASSAEREEEQGKENGESENEGGISWRRDRREIGNVTECLAMVLCRCSQSARADAYRRDIEEGGALKALLLRIMQLCCTKGEIGEFEGRRVAAEETSRIFSGFSCCVDVNTIMARDSDLVDTLMAVAESPLVSEDAKDFAIGALANILSTDNTEQELTLQRHPRLIDTLAEIVQNIAPDRLKWSCLCKPVAFAFYNLTVSSIAIRSRMAASQAVRHALCRLLQGLEPDTARIAAETVTNIVQKNERHSNMLSRHEDGLLLKRLFACMFGEGRPLDMTKSEREEYAEALWLLTDSSVAKTWMAREEGLLGKLMTFVSKEHRGEMAINLVGSFVEDLIQDQLLNFINACSVIASEGGLEMMAAGLNSCGFRDVKSRLDNDDPRLTKLGCPKVFRALVAICEAKILDIAPRNEAIDLLWLLSSIDGNKTKMAKDLDVIQVLINCAKLYNEEENDHERPYQPEHAAEALAWIVNQGGNTRELVKVPKLFLLLEHFASTTKDLGDRRDARKALEMLQSEKEGNFTSAAA